MYNLKMAGVKKAETFNCTLGSIVNTHLPANKQIMLD